MLPIPIWVKLLIVIAVAVVAFGCGWKWRADIAERDRLAAEVGAFVQREGLQKKADTIAEELENKLSAARRKAELAEGELFDELRKPIYSDCVVPADGVRIINSAIEDR